MPLYQLTVYFTAVFKGFKNKAYSINKNMRKLGVRMTFKTLLLPCELVWIIVKSTES